MLQICTYYIVFLYANSQDKLYKLFIYLFNLINCEIFDCLFYLTFFKAENTDYYRKVYHSYHETFHQFSDRFKPFSWQCDVRRKTAQHSKAHSVNGSIPHQHLFNTNYRISSYKTRGHYFFIESSTAGIIRNC